MQDYILYKIKKPKKSINNDGVYRKYLEVI